MPTPKKPTNAIVGFFQKLEMRSIIALIAVVGAIVVGVAQPEHTASSLNILSLCIGGYFGQLMPHEGTKEG